MAMTRGMVSCHSGLYLQRASLRGLRGNNGKPYAVSLDGGIWIKVHLLNLAAYDREGAAPIS